MTVKQLLETMDIETVVVIDNANTDFADPDFTGYAFDVPWSLVDYRISYAKLYGGVWIDTCIFEGKEVPAIHIAYSCNKED